MTEQRINMIICRIIDDLTDRRGLRQEWENTDLKTRKEIKKVWHDIIFAELEEEQQEKCEWTRNEKRFPAGEYSFPLYNTECGAPDLIYLGGYCCNCGKRIERVE